MRHLDVAREVTATVTLPQAPFDRPSHPAWEPENVISHLVEGADVDFDPRLVQTFLDMLRAAGLAAPATTD